MAWDTLFSVANLWALIAWLLLIAGPRKPLAHTAVMFLGVGLLCLTYVLLLAGLVSGTLDDGGLGSGTGSGAAPSLLTLAGVMAIFDSPGGAVTGWVHYLALDLFTGLWIARDADGKGFGRIVQAPILLLTFVAGPAGLLLWLIVRERRARRMARNG